MKGIRVPVLSLVALCAAFLLFLEGTKSWLPEHVATHFGGDGRANGWMPRFAAVNFLAALGTGLPLLFCLLGILIRAIPARFFNLPHREYWLAPERREATSAYLANQLIWLGCVMVLFFAALHLVTIAANRQVPARLPIAPFLMVVGVFLATIAVGAVAMLRRFARPQ